MATFIDRVIADRRTLRQALVDIRVKYERTGDPDLAEMIRHAEAEIIERERKSPAEVG
jgi:hypothetical protein